MQGTCPERDRCAFFMSIYASPVLRVKYATMYPFCNAGKHEACMRWWLMSQGKDVPGDLLPDGGKDLFAADAHRSFGHDRYKVLVVDDMPLFRKALAGLVDTACGGRVLVIEAESGEAALDLLENSGDWDAVVTDYNMGGMTGFDLIRSMRSNPTHSQVPAIVFSSEKDAAKRDSCATLPRVRWLEKRPDQQPFIEAWVDLVMQHKA